VPKPQTDRQPECQDGSEPGLAANRRGRNRLIDNYLCDSRPAADSGIGIASSSPGSERVRAAKPPRDHLR